MKWGIAIMTVAKLYTTLNQSNSSLGRSMMIDLERVPMTLNSQSTSKMYDILTLYSVCDMSYCSYKHRAQHY